jgi:hypothetical protein
MLWHFPTFNIVELDLAKPSQQQQSFKTFLAVVALYFTDGRK